MPFDAHIVPNLANEFFKLNVVCFNFFPLVFNHFLDFMPQMTASLPCIFPATDMELAFF